MAVGNAMLDEVLADGFLVRVDTVARGLWRGLIELQNTYQNKYIDTVRGAGLMLGIKLSAEQDNVSVVSMLRERGLLTVPAGDNVIRILPPLIITDEHVAKCLDILDATFMSL